ncbi:MAG: FAD-binding oxidoreductase [Ignavibacteriales bacterium]|nr:FAD-binding oxidoreductase [Ignavibacteriales bacterium]
MNNRKVQTKSGSILDEAKIEEFKSALRGQLIRPGDDSYNSTRKIWNAMIDKYPSLIVRSSGVSDIIHSVNFARNNNLIVAVRGGGHNIAGNAICDGGLVIDLSLMKSVRIDASSKTARVEAGATLGDFDHEAQLFGFATPLGINSTTGVAGLTLGGGFGWLSRKYGLSIDNLISVEVVTVSGKLIKASKSENSDLFWAIRGGGGNFGIVTSFEFQLHNVGPEVLAGLIIHPINAARDTLRFYRDFIKSTPDDFVCWFVLRKAPPLPFLAPEWHGKEILALAVCYSGKVEQGERIAKPLRSYGRPLADIIGPMQYKNWQTVLDPLLTPGMRNYWKSHDFLELSDGLIDTLIEYARKIPDPQTEIAMAQLGGKVSKIPIDATAYTHRDAQYIMNVHGRWEDSAKDEACIAWARGLYQAVTPYATGGVYVNFLTQEEQDRVHNAYGSNYNKLVEIKIKYDPNNFFSINQNISPTYEYVEDDE